MRSSVVYSAIFASVILFSGALCTPHTAFAHGSGLTLTSTTTDFFVDVDYSDFSLYAQETGRFDFKLFKDAERTESVAFTQVWVRMLKGTEIEKGETIFSGWITRAIFGSTGMSIQFPAAGPYTMIVRYNNGDDQIVEAQLAFTVDPNTDSEPFSPDRNFWIGLTGGTVLLGAAFLVYSMQASRRRR